MLAAAPWSCGRCWCSPGRASASFSSQCCTSETAGAVRPVVSAACFECLPVVTVCTLSAWWTAQEAGAVISDAAGNPLDFSQGRFFPWLHGGIVAATPRQASVPRLVRAVSYEPPLQSAVPLAACPCRPSSSPSPGPSPLQHACCHHEGAPQHSFARTGAAAGGVGVQPLPGPACVPGRPSSSSTHQRKTPSGAPPHVACTLPQRQTCRVPNSTCNVMPAPAGTAAGAAHFSHSQCAAHMCCPPANCVLSCAVALHITLHPPSLSCCQYSCPSAMPVLRSPSPPPPLPARPQHFLHHRPAIHSFLLTS